IEGALGHDVVHGLDISVALGLERRVPPARIDVLLKKVTPKSTKFFGADVGGVELRADDLDWSYGSGTVLRGSAQDLLLVLYGRKLPAGRLRGEPQHRFAQQAA
ncbi:maleylpyruvate isomerase family mycothiol-dependent enzyme, partial [Streptomyces sp. NPDC059900]